MSSHQITRTVDFSTQTNVVTGTTKNFSGLRSMIAVYRQRRALARLDSYQLQDLGLTREQADAEAARPFWDVPSTWRQNSKSPAFSDKNRQRGA